MYQKMINFDAADCSEICSKEAISLELTFDAAQCMSVHGYGNVRVKTCNIITWKSVFSFGSKHIAHSSIWTQNNRIHDETLLIFLSQDNKQRETVKFTPIIHTL